MAADSQQVIRAETDKKIARLVAEELKVKVWQVEAAVSLIDEGNTIPFIARYRKEATGTLDDEQLRTLGERLTYLRNLEEKKEKVIESIEAQGKMTAELRAQIEGAQTQVAVEDLYRPFRPKRRTRASAAKEKGLQGLADWLISPAADHPVLEEARKYVSEDKEVASPEEALQGAKDILAEMISDKADYRTWIRESTLKDGFVTTAKRIPRPKKTLPGKLPTAAKKRALSRTAVMSMKCIFSTRRRFPEFPDTGCWRSTAVKRKAIFQPESMPPVKRSFTIWRDRLSADEKERPIHSRNLF